MKLANFAMSSRLHLGPIGDDDATTTVTVNLIDSESGGCLLTPLRHRRVGLQCTALGAFHLRQAFLWQC